MEIQNLFKAKSEAELMILLQEGLETLFNEIESQLWQEFKQLDDVEDPDRLFKIKCELDALQRIRAYIEKSVAMYPDIIQRINEKLKEGGLNDGVI